LHSRTARIPSRPTPTATTLRSTSKNSSLPAALAKRATAASTAKTSRLRREAHAALALIARRKREIIETF
jgi:hypothetical protein